MKSNYIEKIQKRAVLVDAANKLVWLDRPTAAAYMGIGTTYLDILIKQRSLPASKLGGRVIVRRQDIDEYLKLCAPTIHSLSEYNRKSNGRLRANVPAGAAGPAAQETLLRSNQA